MQLKFQEDIDISRIITVNYCHPTEEASVHHYSPSLRFYELIFMVFADNDVLFSGQQLKDTDGCLRYLPKGDRRGEYTVQYRKPYECFDVFFDSPDALPPFAAVEKDMHFLKGDFSRLYNVWNGKRPGYYADSMALLYSIFAKLQKASAAYINGQKSEKLRPAYEYIVENCMTPSFSYQAAANAAGLSYDYFRELFLAQYKMSPSKYVTAFRMEKARELLVTGHYNITEIAEACGYDGIYYFSAVFKKYYGVSPSGYRFGTWTSIP